MQYWLNGKTMQGDRTNQLAHDVPTMVSFMGQHVMLKPGAWFFSGPRDDAGDPTG